VDPAPQNFAPSGESLVIDRAAALFRAKQLATRSTYYNRKLKRIDTRRAMLERKKSEVDSQLRAQLGDLNHPAVPVALLGPCSGSDADANNNNNNNKLKRKKGEVDSPLGALKAVQGAPLKRISKLKRRKGEVDSKLGALNEVLGAPLTQTPVDVPGDAAILSINMHAPVDAPGDSELYNTNNKETENANENEKVMLYPSGSNVMGLTAEAAVRVWNRPPRPYDGMGD
jgi:hypothetical protein